MQELFRYPAVLLTRSRYLLVIVDAREGSLRSGRKARNTSLSGLQAHPLVASNHSSALLCESTSHQSSARGGLLKPHAT